MEHIEKALAKARREKQRRAEALGGEVAAEPSRKSSVPPREDAAPAVEPSAFRIDAKTVVTADSPMRAAEPDLAAGAASRSEALVALNYENPVADIFRLLRTQVLSGLAKLQANTLGVCSSNQGEGKTFIAANLAASIALSREQPVLLMDFDLRRPSVHSLLGLDASPGVTDYLNGGATLADCVRKSSISGLDVWTAGASVRNSSEALGSSRLLGAFEYLRSSTPKRVLICDLPPLLAGDDALMLSARLDATILVVEENRTKPGEIQRALTLLDASKVIGTVLNRSHFKNPFPYSHYYD